MNSFFQSLTWGQFCQALIAATVLYYLYVAIRFYGSDIRQMFNKNAEPPEKAPRHLSIAVFDQEQPGHDRMQADSLPAGNSAPPPDEFQFLTAALRAEIAESSELPYDPLAAIAKLKTILQGYARLADSPRRAEINRFIAAECEKNGIAQLTDEVVDAWWES